MYQNDEVHVCILLAGHYMYGYLTHEKRWNKITILANKKARSFNPNVTLKNQAQVENLYRSILHGWLHPRDVFSDWVSLPYHDGKVREKINEYDELEKKKMPHGLPAAGRRLLMEPIKEEEVRPRYLLKWHD